MRGGDGRGSPAVSRRVLLAAGGAVLLTSTAAAVDADARAHGMGTQPRPAPNVPADRADGTPGTRVSTSSGTGEARAAASPPARKHSAPAGSIRCRPGPRRGRRGRSPGCPMASRCPLSRTARRWSP